MVKANTNYQLLKPSYLFSDIAKRINQFIKDNPNRSVIKMGIGDVTSPLIPEVICAMHLAVDEMSKKETFRGYGPEQGYDFLKEALRGYYKNFGVSIDLDEIFVSDGAKSDIANITDLFSNDNTIIVPDPVYPVYVDTNLMLNRKIIYVDGNISNGFLPLPYDGLKGDIIYLCSPNNPTGAVYSKEQLKLWVDYALNNKAVILFDAAYECFIREDYPHSIFEIEGAKDCAIEFCSFSKTAGFTGTRCGYTVVPKNLIIDGQSLNKMWLRRQTTKFNGVSYIVQRGAAAVFTKEGQISVKKVIDGYLDNAKILGEAMRAQNIWYTGGVNSPYIWFKCPEDMDSWDFFDAMLNKIGVTGTPGSGFGKQGEGYFRLTAFNTKENTILAAQKFSQVKNWR